jgi:hypothetical protein
MASGVLDVSPKGGTFSSMIDIPVATFKIRGQVPVNKRPAPAAGGELVEVSDQNVIELFVL